MDETIAGDGIDPGGKSRSLALALEAEILRGRYRAGDRLPPVRELATELGLAANTVAAAYRRLAQRGLVEGRGRAGTVVSAVAKPSRAVVPALTEGVVDLAAGNPDPRLLPDWAPVLHRIADGWSAPLYGDPPILDALAEVAGRDLAADGVDPTHLCLVSGALDGLERVLATNLRHGDTVAIEDPGYRPVRSLLAALGLRALPMALDRDGVRPESLAASLDSGVEAVVVTPRAQNPTGAAITSERAAALAALVATHPNVMIIEDDHAGPVAGAPLTSVGRSAARWAVIRSAAKTYGPDLRLAVVAGDEVTVDRVASRLATGMGWVPRLLQELAVGLMVDPAVTAGLDTARAVYADRRDCFAQALVAAEVLAPEATPRSGFNVWIPVADEGAVVAAMLSQGFAVTPGAGFRLRAAPAVRVSVSNVDDGMLDAAAEALCRVLTATASPRSA